MSLINSQQDINTMVSAMTQVNSNLSQFNPGHIKDLNSLEAVISKMQYFDDPVEAIIEFFIAGHNIHAFHDGNKRTMQTMLVIMLENFSEYTISDCVILADAQIYYISRIINIDEFKMIIKKLLIKVAH